ncbi:MAG: hypothetical protein AB8C46_16665 [Burkholderiaceae bacterium]
MNITKSLPFVVAASLLCAGAALNAPHALAQELFEPSNSHLSQSTLAPGSRLFISVEDETAVRANERFVSDPAAGAVVFAPTERKAIAHWLARAERSITFTHDHQALTVPMRVTYTNEPFYAN